MLSWLGKRPPSVVGAVALVALLVASGAASPAAASWEQFRGDSAKTGHLVDATAPRSTGWVFEPSQVSQLVASPVSDGLSVVEANYLGHLTAIDILDGTQLWVQRTPDTVTATPAVSGDLVLVGSGKSLLAYRVQPSGSSVMLEWSFNTTARIDSAPTIEGDAVYFGSDDRSVYKVNITNGALLWNFTTGDVVKASPAVHDGRVFVGSYDGSLYALSDGGSNVSLDWVFDAGTAIGATPAVKGGSVYVCTQGGRVFALDQDTGDKRWESAPGGVIVASPAVADGLLFIGGDTLSALDLQNGVVVWDRTLGGYVRSSPAVWDGMVYAGDYAGRLYAFKTDGSPSWSFDTGSAIRTSPAVVGGLVVVGNDDGLLYALPIDAGLPPEVQPLLLGETFAGVHETFSVVASDPERRDVRYSWSFGDGSDAQGRVVQHTYGSPGNYTVTVTVSDGQETTQVSGTITVKPFSSEVSGGQQTDNTPRSDNTLLYAGAGAGGLAVVGLLVLFVMRRRGQAGGGREEAPAAPARVKAALKDAPRAPARPPTAPPARGPAPPSEFDYYRQYGGSPPPAQPPARQQRGPRRPPP